MIYFKIQQGGLLKRALWPLYGFREGGFVRYSPEGIWLTFMSYEQTTMGVLRLRSADLEFFQCDGEGNTIISVYDIYDLLLMVDDDQSLSMYGDYWDPDAQFLILHHGSTVGLSGYLPLHDVDNDDKPPDYSQVEYHLVVAITAKKFRVILRRMVAPSAVVSMFITNNQVKFSTTNGEIVLRTEDSECIIGSAINEPLQLNFLIDHIKHMWRASLLTSMVWIENANDSRIMFNFPFGYLGNVMLYAKKQS